MIIVRVELHSAITGKVTEIARMGIANTGGDHTHGDYHVETWRGRSAEQLRLRKPQRTARVTRHARLRLHVWHLVARALVALNYAGAAAVPQDCDPLDAETHADGDGAVIPILGRIG